MGKAEEAESRMALGSQLDKERCKEKKGLKNNENVVEQMNYPSS